MQKVQWEILDNFCMTLLFLWAFKSCASGTGETARDLRACTGLGDFDDRLPWGAHPHVRLCRTISDSVGLDGLVLGSLIVALIVAQCGIIGVAWLDLVLLAMHALL